MIPVLDSSSWQSNTAFDSKAMTLAPGWRAPDLSVAAAEGVKGNVARGSIGDRVDPYYAPCARAARDAGIVPAAYHWLEGLPLVAEVSAIHRAIDTEPPVFFMLDVEDNDMTADVWRDRKLLDYVFGALELVQVERRIIYTAGWWWNQRVSAAVAAEYRAQFAKYELMVAYYPHQPAAPAGHPDPDRWKRENWPVVPVPARWDGWLRTDQAGPSGRVDAGGVPAAVTGWETWGGWQGGSWAFARDYGFASNARIDFNVVRPDAWARWTTPQEVPPVEILYPAGYGTDHVTEAELRRRYESKMEPEFARRLFAWLRSKGGTVGIGGGRRTVQPDKPGFAPAGKSFHQDQRYVDGTTWYTAVDLVAPDGPDGNNVHDAVGWHMVAPQGSAEARLWGVHCNVSTEAWHMQPVEIDGYDSWVAAGRQRPAPNYPIPGHVAPPPTIEEDDMPQAVPIKAPGAPPIFLLPASGPLTWVAHPAELEALRNAGVIAHLDERFTQAEIQELLDRRGMVAPTDTDHPDPYVVVRRR